MNFELWMNNQAETVQRAPIYIQIKYYITCDIYNQIQLSIENIIQ